jgi:hypothetical protein
MGIGDAARGVGGDQFAAVPGDRLAARERRREDGVATLGSRMTAAAVILPQSMPYSVI